MSAGARATPRGRWFHAVEDWRPPKPDVWPSEIRIHYRGRTRAQIMRALARLRRRWKVKEE